ncbi:hypothetical protein SPRG_14626 [Saprolegnia parasitica CBS 223.65]|uniref:Uncharacterized protein n=1 Tax=Saprolegnia parasitica (strain CBS 223.65) TaxID=695850 RepID=A0A067BZU8_SAPPC|nr:hypothetical protein SPRG_14626 [Saprolegnia parasitica CBS 223.65]KDO20087.1 hypothetical protein SPRG_14626 [Saprolegnia parasitica CBS 223.65]|eukprot:XP_012209190.1 hypothetical protein SPRG_14626 [Saprolegnia parasitica CBS 223.65]
MGWWWTMDGHLHVYAAIGAAMVAKACQEAWLAAFYQYEALAARGNSRRVLGRLRFGYWSLFGSQLAKRWMLWLPGLLLVAWWVWNRYLSGSWSTVSVDTVDDADVPELEPIEPTSVKRPATTTPKATTTTTQRQKKTLLTIQDQEASQKRKSERAFQALLAQKAKFEHATVERPSGWMVYDAAAGKLVLASGD